MTPDNIDYIAPKSSFTLFETFSFSISGVIIWFISFPIAHAALGISALYIWIPGSVISMFTNFQVKNIIAKYIHLPGGTPIYTAKMLSKFPFLARYGAIGHTWAWMTLALINSYLFNDTIQQEFNKYGIQINSIIVISCFLLFCYLIALASQRLSGVVHMFLVYPLIVLLCYVFGSLGLYALNHPEIIYNAQWRPIGFLTFIQWYFFLMYTLYNGDIVTSFICETKKKTASANILTIVALFMPVVFVLGSWCFAMVAPKTFDGNITNFLTASLYPVFGDNSTLLTIVLILFTTIISSITGIGIAVRTLLGLSNFGLMSKHLGYVSKRNTFDNAIVTSAIVTIVFGLFLRNVEALIAMTGLTCCMLYALMRIAYWHDQDTSLPFKKTSLVVGIVEILIIIVGCWLINPYILLSGLLLPLSHPVINWVSSLVNLIGQEVNKTLQFMQKFRPDFEIYNLMVMIGIVVIGSALVYTLNVIRVMNTPLISVISYNPSLFLIFIIIFMMIVIMLSGWTTIPQVVEIEHTREQLEIANNNLLTDIKKREKIEKELWGHVYVDSLTELGNRKLLYETLKVRISLYQDGNISTSLLFLDLDRFKIINDSLGHTVGDFVIKKTAQSLQELSKPHQVYRLAGDEFVIVIDGDMNNYKLTELAEYILKHFNTPLKYDGKDIYTMTSLGIATINSNHLVPDDIVRDSDIAMYYAKQHGLRYSFFVENMKLYAQETHELDTSIRHAIANKEFSVYYQPIHNLKTMRLDSVEVLMRWFHPTKGSISPSEFIPIAEKNGYINAIGAFMLETACQQTKEFLQLMPNLTVSINLSATQLKPKNIELLISIIQNNSIPMSSINIELTESILIEENKEVAVSLRLLKEKGIKLHLDDFGTGYSSLSYLQTLPIEVLKIDRAFVSNRDNRNIAKAVQTIAQNMNLQTIAEGIESEEDFKTMQEYGCDYGQGYYFAKPMSFENIITYINNPNYETPKQL
jgi:diguanylate cyclase (GGDEF)-like protein